VPVRRKGLVAQAVLAAIRVAALGETVAVGNPAQGACRGSRLVPCPAAEHSLVAGDSSAAVDNQEQEAYPDSRRGAYPAASVADNSEDTLVVPEPVVPYVVASAAA